MACACQAAERPIEMKAGPDLLRPNRVEKVAGRHFFNDLLERLRDWRSVPMNVATKGSRPSNYTPDVNTAILERGCGSKWKGPCRQDMASTRLLRQQPALGSRCHSRHRPPHFGKVPRSSSLRQRRAHAARKPAPRPAELGGWVPAARRHSSASMVTTRGNFWPRAAETVCSCLSSATSRG